MSELHETWGIDQVAEGLSHEPLIEEMARWTVDESLELGYEPDLSDLARTMNDKYGVTLEQTIQAIAGAISRYTFEVHQKDFYNDQA